MLGLGLFALTVTLSAVAVILGYRQAPHRVAQRQRVRKRASRATRAATSSGFPAPAVTGMCFALEPGRGRTSVRSAILGAALAVIVVVATLTFGASLHTLVSRPALYGWNWNDALGVGIFGCREPPPTTDR